MNCSDSQYLQVVFIVKFDDVLMLENLFQEEVPHLNMHPNINIELEPELVGKRKVFIVRKLSHASTDC